MLSAPAVIQVSFLGAEFGLWSWAFDFLTGIKIRGFFYMQLMQLFSDFLGVWSQCSDLLSLVSGVCLLVLWSRDESA